MSTRSPESTKRLRNGHSASSAHVAAGLGALAGAAAGAIGGPPGLVVGAVLGAVVGEAAGEAMLEREDLLGARERALDSAIGVTSGAIGVGRGAVLDFLDMPSAATFLRGDHAALAAQAGAVLEAVAAGDPEDVCRAITLLQTNVVAHLDGEERDLLPRYMLHAPADARVLLAEHCRFREALAQLDVANDLHLVRADALRALVTELLGHAAREEAGLYAWATAEVVEVGGAP